MSTDWWIVLALAVAPAAESRAAIVWGVLRGLPPWGVYFAASLVSVPAILAYWAGLRVLQNFLLRYPFFQRWITRRSPRFKALVERYGFLGVTLFVAIPWVGTGWYTGGLLCLALNLSPFRSLLALIAGMLLSGLLTLAGSLPGSGILQ